MFDYVDVALEEFESLRADGARSTLIVDGRRLGRWIREEAVKAIEELIAKEEFRRQALWSAERLSAGAGSNGRTMVEQVEAALVAHAEALAGWASNPNFETASAKLDAARPSRFIVPIDRARASVEFIASRPWHDLISARDLLSPTAGLNLKVPLERDVAEFVPMLDASLQYPGDHVAGMALRRIRFWHEELQRFRSRCHRVARECEDAADTPVAVTETADALARSMGDFEALLTLGPHARLREACASLLQAYAAYAPRADLSWARMPSSAQAPTLAYWLESQQRTTIATRVAAALGEVVAIYRQPRSTEEAIRDLWRSYMLVVIGGGRKQLYWRQEPVLADWTAALWETLWALVRDAKSGGYWVNEQSFSHDGRGNLGLSRRALISRVSRVGKLLPPKLREQLEENEASYQLKVPNNEIYLAEVQPDGSVIDACPRRRR